jgi:SAM-dependent methyltransferase
MPYFKVQFGKWKQVLAPHIVANPQVDKVLATLDEGAVICDVGAGGRRLTPDTITVDRFWGSETDLMSDAAALALKDESVDCAACTGTLEHLPDPWAAAREIVRVVKPGGLIYVDAPFMQGYHADPHDYWRFTQDGLRQLFPGFEELDAGVHMGPASGLAWVFVAFCQGLARSERVRKLMFRLGSVIAFPWKYVDLFAVKSPYSYLAASGVYYVGRKPERGDDGS